jgi:HPr kinase/phosphorylase
MDAAQTIHGVAVALGDVGLLLRGPSGAGKSSLAAEMMAHWPYGTVRLVADDRVVLTRHEKRLVARPHPAIAAQIELRGFGITRVPWLDSVVVRGCIDLAEASPDRLPSPEDRQATVLDVPLVRLQLSCKRAPFLALVTVWPYFRDEMLKV